ncbi:DUF2512 family protein [Paenibacillus flagellatus]|uniref:DUF2512 domain-containing protein n=1 Tax=Paenibacillus flagellatus TaxID=2211139 RepID=A0A2V5K8Q6_9BACL|nr:DUF2512 family protein [Paenibacillus flagellatus]PYI55778.1 hypothetical protein DLM86_08660 [Paenibacillus flagellatus]
MGKFLVKLFVNGAIAVSLLYWFTEASLLSCITASVVFTLIAYAIGDQFILRTAGNGVATTADAVMAFVYFWAVAYIMDWSLSWTELLTLTLLLGIAEFMIHRLMRMDSFRQFSK